MTFVPKNHRRYFLFFLREDSLRTLHLDKSTRTPQSPMKLFNANRLMRRNACPVKEEVVAPFWANNTRGEVLALLNFYPFEQYVHWEKCTWVFLAWHVRSHALLRHSLQIGDYYKYARSCRRNENKQMYCRDGCRCEQQYRLHRLLAYDPNNECRGIFSDWFKFPSCCVCRCYDLPLEFRVTSRSPRTHSSLHKRRIKVQAPRDRYAWSNCPGRSPKVQRKWGQETAENIVTTRVTEILNERMRRGDRCIDSRNVSWDA